MEFASVVWNPCYNVDVVCALILKLRLHISYKINKNKEIDKLEKIQRRAARWVISDYNRTSSMTQILNQLSWPTIRT